MLHPLAVRHDKKRSEARERTPVDKSDDDNDDDEVQYSWRTGHRDVTMVSGELLDHGLDSTRYYYSISIEHVRSFCKTRRNNYFLFHFLLFS